MITEDYVSFETAKILKEKGFPQYKREDGFAGLKYNMNGELTTAPYAEHYRVITQAMAMKWLREVHNIAIETEWEHLWYAYVKPMTSKPSEQDYYQCESSKYEESCEAAIKYCLENLEVLSNN